MRWRAIVACSATTSRFLTGMDEHSAQVERLARRARRPSRATLVDAWAVNWRAAFDKFEISYDRFIRTTDDDHAGHRPRWFGARWRRGDIYKGTYSGWYCPGDNEFKTEAQLVDGHCPDHPDARAPVARGGELVLRACRKYQERARAALPRQPVVLRAGALPQRGPRLAARGAARLLDQPRRARTGASRSRAIPTTGSTSGSTR